MTSLENMDRKTVIANLLKDAQKDMQEIETFLTDIEKATNLANGDWNKLSKIFRNSVRPQYRNHNWRERIPMFLENDKKTLMVICSLLNKVIPELEHKDKVKVDSYIAKAQMLIYRLDKLLQRLENAKKIINIDDRRLK